MERLFDKVNVKNYKIKICARCGKEFKPNSGKQKYCKKCILIIIREHCKRWDKEHREGRQEINRRWREEHKEYNKQYYKEYRERIKEYYRQWKEEHKEYNKQWREENRERIKEYYKENQERIKEYYKEHQERIKEYNRQWKEEHPDRARELAKKQQNKRRRNLGFIPLNKYSEGFEAHHIDRNYVIYIPKEVHQNIRHSVLRNKNMDEINAVAFNYL